MAEQKSPDSKAATKVQEDLFATVKADVNRLFTLENTQLQVQDQQAVAQGNIALNLINVYRALGGGWEYRLRDDCGASGKDWRAPAEAPAARGPEPLPAPKPVQEPK